MSVSYQGTLTDQILDRAKREMTREELQFMEDKWADIVANNQALRMYSSNVSLTNAIFRDTLVAEKAFYLGYSAARCKKPEESKLGQTLK